MYLLLTTMQLPTKTVVEYMTIESAKKLNFFPARHSISKYHSPRMILHQENLDFERHCVYSLREYA